MSTQDAPGLANCEGQFLVMCLMLIAISRHRLNKSKILDILSTFPESMLLISGKVITIIFFSLEVDFCDIVIFFRSLAIDIHQAVSQLTK